MALQHIPQTLRFHREGCRDRNKKVIVQNNNNNDKNDNDNACSSAGKSKRVDVVFKYEQQTWNKGEICRCFAVARLRQEVY